MRLIGRCSKFRERRIGARQYLFHLTFDALMMIHSVYFWLRDDLSDEHLQQFKDGVASLLTIDTVKAGYVGTPAETPPRDIIDSSYDYGLVTVFDDVAAHDAYQIDPVHDAFRELAPLWTKVQIYDTTVTAST